MNVLAQCAVLLSQEVVVAEIVLITEFCASVFVLFYVGLS